MPLNGRVHFAVIECVLIYILQMAATSWSTTAVFALAVSQSKYDSINCLWDCSLVLHDLAGLPHGLWRGAERSIFLWENVHPQLACQEDDACKFLFDEKYHCSFGILARMFTKEFVSLSLGAIDALGICAESDFELICTVQRVIKSKVEDPTYISCLWLMVRAVCVILTFSMNNSSS